VADAGQLYRQLRAEELVGPSFSISINASARELDEPSFVADFTRRAKDAGLDAADIILEITERALVNDPEAATKALEELRSAGMRLAIDDFGTGYSSLSVLQRFPVDILKVAKPFIDDLPAQRQSFADAIVRLGATLGLETVAEGIEKSDQLEQLRELNCTYGQGFYLSRPLGTMQLVEHLRAERAARGRTDLGNDRHGLHVKEALEPPASGHA
jgi:EAL domain-containing protein (putative c-di-GMP-specific phosphodiesterase class I)